MKKEIIRITHLNKIYYFRIGSLHFSIDLIEPHCWGFQIVFWKFRLHGGFYSRKQLDNIHKTNKAMSNFNKAMKLLGEEK